MRYVDDEPAVGQGEGVLLAYEVWARAGGFADEDCFGVALDIGRGVPGGGEGPAADDHVEVPMPPEFFAFTLLLPTIYSCRSPPALDDYRNTRVSPKFSKTTDENGYQVISV